MINRVLIAGNTWNCSCYGGESEAKNEWVEMLLSNYVPWNSGLKDGIDLIAKDPRGELVHYSHDKTSEKFEFVVHREGLHQFCFKNKGPHYETVDFDIHIRHFAYHGQRAKDEHLNPLMTQLAKLQQSLFDVQFEQHCLEAQTDRQAILNQGMSKRAMHKAMLEMRR
ncbi:transmembrane emp24 domain-containing protein p24beta2-like [Papaver somniferum]|uniref:transmembrane emp24 domain-containing protein p24beta2-like n=1 Tax=Papaver somniferum TaxID=3469 RepID=UPI000E7030FF|nr:transmembrane emp24 domain-containing protein p24beta2-like [Papaver somniferum]